MQEINARSATIGSDACTLMFSVWEQPGNWSITPHRQFVQNKQTQQKRRSCILYKNYYTFTEIDDTKEESLLESIWVNIREKNDIGMYTSIS